MGIKAIMDEIDPEATVTLGDLYTKGDDGKFTLDVESVDGLVLENVDGLKNALVNERNEVKTLKSKVGEFESSVEKLTGEITTLRDTSTDVNEKATALSEQRINENNAAWEAKGSAWEQERAQYQSDLRTYAIDNAAIRAIEHHKGNAKLLLREVKAAADIVKGQDGSLHVVIKDAEGNPRYADPVKGTYMGIEDFVAEMKKDDDWALAFEGSGGSGSGSRGADRANGAAGMPKHRGDFADTKTKAAWVRENGQAAFEKLPMAPRT
jgi:hypothetical protein